MKPKVIALLSLIVFLAGCGTATRWKETAFTERSGIEVKLQQQVREGRAVNQNYSHPIDIDSVKLAWFLDELSYQEEPFLFGDPQKKSVFLDEEIDKLAPALSRALKEADSSQRLRFKSFNYGTGLVLKKRRVTEGVLFVDSGGNLNVAFSWINEPVDLEDEPKAQQHIGRRNVLEIEVAEKPLVIDEPYMWLHELKNGKKAPMWVEGSVKGLKETVEKIRPTVDTSAEKQEAAKPSSSRDYGREDVQSKKSMEDVKTRLEYLKDLHEEGLIDKSEYEAQKKKVLKDL